MDYFADRQTIQSDSGQIIGSNIGTSLEPDEPKHAGKPGGHSVWISWIAPADGIATFDTTGSDFDTLLGVYSLQPGTDPPMKRLKEVAGNDDTETAKTSLVQFGVVAGAQYEVAVDGYAEATGSIQLNWSLLRSSNPPPIILNVPPDRSLKAGDTLALTVDYQNSDSVKLVWVQNDIDLPGDQASTLVITNFQAENTGQYKLRFSANGGIRFFTSPIEVQINSEGLTNILARDKLLDAEDSGLKHNDATNGALLRVAAKTALPRARQFSFGVARGYNGTQIFNTAFATADPGEPQHCGVAGGASYWFAYQPPTNGTVTLDTDGSTFDTVLAVYTFVPPLTGYAGLIPVNCDNNSGTNGLTSRLQFTAAFTNTYLVVVDGVNGARGVAYLNYSLKAEPPTQPTPPLLSTDLISQTQPIGGVATFSVVATGTPPLAYQWFKDGLSLTNETTSTLILTNLLLDAAGAYSVRVSNPYGSVTSSVAMLSVLAPTTPPLLSTDLVSQTQPVGGAATFSVVAAGTPPLAYQWLKDGLSLTNEITSTLILTNLMLDAAGAYSVWVSNPYGSVTSRVATLSVLTPPAIIQPPRPQNAQMGTALNFTVTVSGDEPLHYAWSRDGLPLTNVDSPVLTIPWVHAEDAGNYTVVVANPVGVIASTPVPLAVLGPATACLNSVSGTVTVSFVAAGGANYVLEFTDQLAPPNWTPWTGSLSTNGALMSLTIDPGTNGMQFFRVHFQ